MDIAISETPMLDDDDIAQGIRDTRVEALFDEWGLEYELDPKFPLARLKIEDSTQIRIAAHRAPSNMVEQYAMHMKHGAVFPPLVITSNGIMVDGTTRLKSALQLGRKYLPVYKVKFAHLGMAKMIGASLNQMGGDRLTEEEIVVAASAMLAEGYGDAVIARHLGRSPSHVANVRREQQYRSNAERTGVTQAGLAIPRIVQRTLGTIKHDEPFRAAVEAVAHAKPSAKDVQAMVDKIEATRSDAEALAAIQQTAQSWGTVQGPPPHQRSLSRSKAKAALKAVRTLLELAESEPAAAVVPNDDDARALWQRLQVMSTHVLALYAQPQA